MFSANEQETFRDSVALVFGDFELRGYILGSLLVQEVAGLGEYLSLTLLWDATATKMEFWYLRTPDGKRDALCVFFMRGQSRVFTIEEYLKWRGAPFDKIKECQLAEYEGALRDRMIRCLSATRSAYDHKLLEALSGVAWPSVPIDWGGLK